MIAAPALSERFCMVVMIVGPFRPISCCCGNRHCPTCQHDKADQWLHKQIEKLLPTHYFLLTLTLPQGLRQVARSHQKTVYGAMFSCAHQALKKLAQDKTLCRLNSYRVSRRPPYLGKHASVSSPSAPGYSGGALSEKIDQWVSSRQGLFVHTKPLAHIFKAKFRDAMKKAQLFDKNRSKPLEATMGCP